MLAFGTAFSLWGWYALIFMSGCPEQQRGRSVKPLAMSFVGASPTPHHQIPR